MLATAGQWRKPTGSNPLTKLVKEDGVGSCGGHSSLTATPLSTLLVASCPRLALACGQVSEWLQYDEVELVAGLWAVGRAKQPTGQPRICLLLLLPRDGSRPSPPTRTASPDITRRAVSVTLLSCFSFNRGCAFVLWLLFCFDFGNPDDMELCLLGTHSRPDYELGLWPFWSRLRSESRATSLFWRLLVRSCYNVFMNPRAYTEAPSLLYHT